MAEDAFMGAPELWRIVASLVGAGLALGAALLVLRLLKIDLERIPKQWIPPAATCFMMVASVALLLTLTQRGPRHVTADPSDGPASLQDSAWRFRVYPLENWGELARRMALGQEISRNVLEELRDLGADARRGAENDIPVGLWDDGRRPSQERIAHFGALAPFMCIYGHVSRNQDGRYEAEVELHEIDHNARSKLLWRKTVPFRGTNESSREAAREIVGDIASLARAETDGATVLPR